MILVRTLLCCEIKRALSTLVYCSFELCPVWYIYMSYSYVSLACLLVVCITCCLCFQVRETRRAVRDSAKQKESMSIGHHIGERSHVIERSRNTRTGEQDQNQEFVNLDEGR